MKPTTKTVVKDTKKKLTGQQIARGVAAKQEFGQENKNPASWVEDDDVWDKAKEAADKNYDRGSDEYWPVVAHIYEQMGGGVKEAKANASRKSMWDAAAVEAKWETFKVVKDGKPQDVTVLVQAAHGEVTGKASFSTIRSKLQEAIEADSRFPSYTRPASPGDMMGYPCKPYVVDILAPDDDGSMEAVVCVYNDDDGDGDIDTDYYRVGFTWDGDTGTVALTGEPQETECTTVYSSRAGEVMLVTLTGLRDAGKTLSNFISCEAAGASLGEKPKWEVDAPVDIQWMPGGQTTIVAGWNGRPIRMTVECDEKTASSVQASYEAHLEAEPNQEPYGCVEHREEEACVRLPRGVGKFEWRDDPEPGVYATVTPTQLGVTNVNGRVHRSWSPSFATDADYAKACCVDCRRKMGTCECDGTQLDFPVGSRGSRTNPARITAVAFSVGSLTNKPAFRNILPVRAKQAASPQPDKTTSGGNNQQKTKGKTMKMEYKFVQEHGEYAVGDVAELEQDDPAVKAGRAMHPDSADALIAARQAVEVVRAEQKTSDTARIDAALDRAVERKALLPKGTQPNSRDTVRAKHMAKFDIGRADADIIVQLIDMLRGEADAKLEERVTTRVEDDSGKIIHSVQLQGCSLRDAGNAYVTKRKQMNHLIRLGKVKEATNLSLETGAIMASYIEPHTRSGKDFVLRDALDMDYVKAAGLDVTDPDSQVGTLATGLVVMRNLGFLKSKLGWMNYVSTDLRNEPVLFGQTVRTRYIVPPAVLTFIPGVGYTRDATTITNASAGTNQDGVAIQTSGTRTTSEGATSTIGDSGAANAVDVDVKMTQHKAVEVEFSTNKLGSTARALFAEQQGAQFYSLAEAINLFFIAKLAAATWTGPVTSFSLTNGFSLPKFLALKNRMTLSRMPDMGRFALLHSYYYDGLGVDTNLLSAKAILALINKDASAFEQADLPTIFGVKPVESQLFSQDTTGAYVAPTVAADGSTVSFPQATTRVGFAGNSASALFVARVPQDYTRALPDIPATAAMEIITEPDSGMSVLITKYVNHILAQASQRCALMYGAAQGDPRQGFVLVP